MLMKIVAIICVVGACFFIRADARRPNKYATSYASFTSDVGKPHSNEYIYNYEDEEGSDEDDESHELFKYQAHYYDDKLYGDDFYYPYSGFYHNDREERKRKKEKKKTKKTKSEIKFGEDDSLTIDGDKGIKHSAFNIFFHNDEPENQENNGSSSVSEEQDTKEETFSKKTKNAKKNKKKKNRKSKKSKKEKKKSKSSKKKNKGKKNEEDEDDDEAEQNKKGVIFEGDFHADTLKPLNQMPYKVKLEYEDTSKNSEPKDTFTKQKSKFEDDFFSSKYHKDHFSGLPKYSSFDEWKKNKGPFKSFFDKDKDLPAIEAIKYRNQQLSHVKDKDPFQNSFKTPSSPLSVYNTGPNYSSYSAISNDLKNPLQQPNLGKFSFNGNGLKATTSKPSNWDFSHPFQEKKKSKNKGLFSFKTTPKPKTTFESPFPQRDFDKPRFNYDQQLPGPIFNYDQEFPKHKHNYEQLPKLPYEQSSSRPGFPYDQELSRPEFPYEQQGVARPVIPYEPELSRPRYPYEQELARPRFPHEQDLARLRFPYEQELSKIRFPYEQGLSNSNFNYDNNDPYSTTTKSKLLGDYLHPTTFKPPLDYKTSIFSGKSKSKSKQKSEKSKIQFSTYKPKLDLKDFTTPKPKFKFDTSISNTELEVYKAISALKQEKREGGLFGKGSIFSSSKSMKKESHNQQPAIDEPGKDLNEQPPKSKKKSKKNKKKQQKNEANSSDNVVGKPYYETYTEELPIYENGNADISVYGEISGTSKFNEANFPPPWETPDQSERGGLFKKFFGKDHSFQYSSPNHNVQYELNNRT